MLQRETELADEAAASFEVFQENWNTVQAFLALQTQWRAEIVQGAEQARAIYTGLRYEAFPVAMVLAGVPRRERQEVYSGLRVMEVAAIKVLNERDDG